MHGSDCRDRPRPSATIRHHPRPSASESEANLQLLQLASPLPDRWWQCFRRPCPPFTAGSPIANAAGLAVQESGLLDLLTDAVQRCADQKRQPGDAPHLGSWLHSDRECLIKTSMIFNGSFHHFVRQLSSSPWLLVLELTMARHLFCPSVRFFVLGLDTVDTETPQLPGLNARNGTTTAVENSAVFQVIVGATTFVSHTAAASDVDVLQWL